jgi:hypothetical protein
MIVIAENLSLLADFLNKELYLSTIIPPTSAHFQPPRLSYMFAPAVLVFAGRVGVK